MYEEDQLAIIIPAYKAKYLRLTMESICKQTDQNFHLYIGDDAGDSKIADIVNSFKGMIKMTYKRFEENLGKSSLVSHWNRCFEMVGSEKWLWLFSDDDLMSHNCVENFRKEVKGNQASKIFKHDSVKFINDLEIVSRNAFDGNVTTGQFLKSKFTYSIESYVVEYIFDRELLKKIGGFPDFPLCWCADDLFWVLASQYSLIVKIRKTTVFWRYSELNISGGSNSRSTSKKKLQACHMFLKALKSSNVFTSEPPLRRLAVFWYLEQYIYLKKGLNYFDRMFFLLELFWLFPLQILNRISLGKFSVKNI
ncbi:glycosyltransferase family A protein [Pedobacter sp. R20-19]|uniref:glycosyltransferase family A protein n=1 Tax=Pedobacter sp. R20-19 TaxID=1270196 RepID=UPI0004939A2B|nr:glycosyltransferase family A protein [Pedobacter sp. R20-19]